jgi:hypothetical protein
MTVFIHHVCYLAGRENIDFVVLKAGEIKIIPLEETLGPEIRTFIFLQF